MDRRSTDLTDLWRNRIDKDVIALNVALTKNTDITKQVQNDVKALKIKTDEMYVTFSAMKGGFKVIEWLGKLAIALTAIAAFLGTVWAMFHFGKVK